MWYTPSLYKLSRKICLVNIAYWIFMMQVQLRQKSYMHPKFEPPGIRTWFKHILFITRHDLQIMTVLLYHWDACSNPLGHQVLTKIYCHITLEVWISYGGFMLQFASYQTWIYIISALATDGKCFQYRTDYNTLNTSAYIRDYPLYSIHEHAQTICP